MSRFIFPESIGWSQKSTTIDVAQLITTTIREIEAARQTLIYTARPLHPDEAGFVVSAGYAATSISM